MSQSDNPFYSVPHHPPAGAAYGAESHGAGASAVDLSAVLKGMWSRKKLMAIIIFSVVAAAVLFVATSTPKFTATAKILLEGPTTSYRDPDLSPNQVRGPRTVGDQDVYSQVEVIESRDLAARVSKTLNLAARSEFDPRSTSISPVKAMLIGLGLSVDPRLQTDEQRVLDKFADKLKAFPVVKSKVIQVEFSSKRPRTAAEVANTLAELYVTSTREVQLDDTRRANGWLTEQIAQLRNEVSRSEAAVEEYRARAGLVQGRSESTTLAQDELSELNRQIALAAAGRAEAVAKAEAIRKLLKERGTVAASNDVTNSNLIQRLREQEIALTRRLADLSTTYLSNHPRILSVRQEINDVRREIRVEALKIVEGLEQQAKVAAAREASLRASMNELKTTASVNKQDEVKLRALEREAKANREQLEALLKRHSDASARQDIFAQPARARIISRAAVPSQPSFPKKGPILMIATGGAIAVALLAAFLVEAINIGGGGAGASVQPHGGYPGGPQPTPTSPPPSPQSPTPGRGGLFAKLKGAMKTTGPGAPAHAAAPPPSPMPPAYAPQAYAPQASAAPAYPPHQPQVPPAYAPPQAAAPSAPDVPNPAWSPAPAPAPVAAPAPAPQAPCNPFAVDQSVMATTPPAARAPEPAPAPVTPIAPAPQPMPQPVAAPAPVPAPTAASSAAPEAAPIIANIAGMSSDLEGLPYLS